MNDNIFKRIEQKYILSKSEYKKIQKLINDYFLKDKYYESKIFNIYFDNQNNDMMINSIEKPIFKKKVRVRKYGNDNKVFLEIKEKYRGMVYKRRIELTDNEYERYICNNKINDKQIMREIDYYIDYYKLKPHMFLAYDRLSYYAKENSRFRLTFDSNMRYRFEDLNLKDNGKNKKYFEGDEYIMEVKTVNSLPIWFVNYLSENKIYPRSFSKAGSIYIKERGNMYV